MEVERGVGGNSRWITRQLVYPVREDLWFSAVENTVGAGNFLREKNRFIKIYLI